MAYARTLAACILLSAGMTASAADSVFIGRIEHITLLPHGHARCPRPCPSGPQPLEHICVSNSCGCAETAVRAEQGIVGALPRDLVIVAEPLGEWCRPPIPPSQDPLLLRIPESGRVEWSVLTRDLKFEAEPFTTIGPVQVSELPAHGGLIRLDDLKRALEREQER